MQRNFPKLHKSLFSWFNTQKRDLPWRINRTPYRVWISEIMLQQTRVTVVVEYFFRWMERFPNILSLSQATEEEVLLLWQGLGYYSRAKNIFKSAKILQEQYDGNFPQSLTDIQTLPGIGLYTASAITVFSYQQKHPLVEANIRRVLARIFGIQKQVSSSILQKEVLEICKSLLPSNPKLVAPFNESLMELGALICTAAAPKCQICPVQTYCVAKNKSLQEEIPIPALPKKYHFLQRNVFVIINNNKEFWLQKRKDSLALLGGLWEFPYQEGNDVEMEKTWLKVGNFVHHYTNNKIAVKVFQKSYDQCKNEFLFDSSGMWVDTQQMCKKPLHAGSVKVLELLGISLV